MKAKEDSFVALCAALSLVAVVGVVTVTLPLLRHPERPWLGLEPPPAAVSSSVAAVGSAIK